MKNVSTLTSLAMLKVRQDHDGSDYLDYLVPFVAFVLSRFQAATAFELQHELEREFGLHLPQRTIELVLNRLVRRREARREGGRYTWTTRPSMSDFESRRTQARRRLQVVINALLNFVATRGLNWTEDEAVNAIISYLSRYTIECLEAYSHGAALPEVPAGSTTSFLVNSFIRDAHAGSTQLFEDIILLVQSQMLMNGLLCPDLQWTKQKFAGVTFFLDTPLVLPLLGLEGEEKKAAVVELIELVRNLKGTVAIFEHTAEEVDFVLDRCERNFNNPNARARIICELRRSGKEASDITLLKAGLHDRYRELGVEVRRSPRRLYNFQIDERALEGAIRDEIRYWNDHALHYDINSIRSIYTLRRGRSPNRLEDAGAVLVTSNVALARVAHQFGRDHESLREVSTVITDMTLANIAWLKAPMGAPDLPKTEVLAACHAAMQPRDGLLEKFVREIARLRVGHGITPQQHEYLRLSPRVRDELMRMTLGDEKRFTKQMVSEILGSAEESILKRERDSFASARQLSDEQIAQLSAQVADLQERVAKADEDAKNRETAITKKSYWLAERCGRFASVAVFVGLSAVLMIACVSAAAQFDKRGGKIGFTASVLAVALLMWDHFTRMWGWSAIDISHRVEAWVTARVFNTLRLQIPTISGTDVTVSQPERVGSESKKEADGTARRLIA